MTLQQTVGVQPAPGLAGMQASNNVFATYNAGTGGLIAGTNAVVGTFGWATSSPADSDGAGAVVNSNGTGLPSGFIYRSLGQGVFKSYLQTSSNLLTAGFPMTLMIAGDWWIVNSGSNFVTTGMKVYANYKDGKATFAATASPTTGASGSTSTIAAGTSSVTGSITGQILTVTVVGSGVLYNGTTLSGTGVTSGTMIVSQISGTTGGVGQYYVSIGEQATNSVTISGTYGLFTAGGTIVSGFTVGDVLSGSSVTSGTYITQLISGTGGAGTYAVTPSGTTGSTAVSSQNNVETKWVATSQGAAGELIKMSSWVNG